MPFISGIELARQVREIRPATNIAFLSGYDDFEYAKQAIQYNIISYMLKPLTMEGLGAELRNIRQKIDAQFACSSPGGPRADEQDLRAAMLMPLVLDDYPRPGRAAQAEALRPAVRPAAGCLDDHPYTRSWYPFCSTRTAPTAPRPSFRGLGGILASKISARRQLFCLRQGHLSAAGQPLGL